jgi:hypothetical protein
VRRWQRSLAAGATCVLLTASVAAGAPAPQPLPTGRAARGDRSPVRPHAIELSAFAGWTIGGALAGQSALLTRDVTGSPEPALPLFTVGIKQTGAPAFGGRIGVNLTREFALEGAVLYTRPELRATISGDSAAPNVPAFTLARVVQWSGDISVIAHLSSLAFANGHAVPFLAAGGGYLRQIVSGSTETIDGQIYNVGGGVKVYSGPEGHQGFRVDAREYLRRPGPDQDATRANFSVAGSVFFVF